MNFEEKLENTVKMKDNFNNNLIVTFIGHKIHKSIGIITSGGDAPGMNSAIRSIVRTSIRFNQNVFGVYRGYDGLINDYICQLGWDTETHNMSEGGTVLLSFRSQKFYEREGRKQAVLNLVKRHINSLIILGGDGSLKGGILLRNEFRELQEELINENKLCIDDYVYSNINEQINEIDNFYGKPECYKETPKINLNRFTGGNNDSIVTSIVTSVESANNSVDNENKEECINENEHNVQIIDNLNNECKSSNMNNENFSTNKDNENTTINKNRDKLNNGIENLQNIKNKEEFITKREEEIKTKDKNLNSENTNVFNITNKSSLNKINSTTTDNSSKNIKNKSKISNESSRNEGKTNSTTQDCLKYNTNLTQEKTLEKNNLNIKDYIYDLKIVGIPASIDNDIYGADFTLGADTAMNRIVESIDHLSSTMRSHQRIFVVEVMGNTCGWLSIMTSISCISDYMLIPEDPPEDWKKEVLENIRFAQKHGKPGMFIIISEGSIDKQNIKIQSSEVVDFIKSYNIDVRLLKLGHVQRGGPTSAFDRILGTLSGIKAFEELFTDLVPRVVLFKDGDLDLYELEHIIEMNDSLKKYQQEKQYNKIIQLRGNLFKTLHRIYNTIISNKKDNRALFMEDINLKLLVQDNIHLKNKYDKLNQKIPSASVRIGIIQCGKRASGMNNSLNSIIQYCYSMKVDPYIILNGFDGLIKDQVIKAQLFEFSNDFNNGGANLGLGSVDILDLKLVLDKLEEHRINNLIIIGDSDCLPLLEELKIENSRRVNCSFIKDENISLSENKKTILCGNKERNFNENKSLSKISDDIKNDNKDHIDKDNDNMNDNNLNNINLKGIDLNKIKTNDINDITIDNYYLKTDSSETYSNIEKNKEFANNVKHCSKENSFDNKKLTMF
ncbi:6-phosphofructokinase (phosphofructo-1-kinase isoenzyme a) [Vairimorpha apis BRL 01]|uniref:6-phosphofructokinase n=1 Tax=Vairimorpha apis BRL 01 TaxID=1037528 RepID=T0LB93_9MICR|nr:6-phosphofructokinase (phosphofructo-1-kinase isoenzyme a) [Vairimorpha apis BRL 01]